MKKSKLKQVWYQEPMKDREVVWNYNSDRLDTICQKSAM